MATAAAPRRSDTAGPRAGTVRVAMIGAGRLATRVHYPSLAGLAGVEIAAACDLDRARLDAVGDRYGIEHRFTDYRAMVEAVAPDAVYAIGPPHHLYDVWVWCLERGLNLYVEKPLGTSLHQARALAHLAERHDCITQVGFQRRASPLATLLRDACLARGPVNQAVCRFYKHGPTPFLGAVDHVHDDTVHAIDTLRWLCGGELSGIDIVTRRLGTPDVNFVASPLAFSTGATGLLMNNWASGRRIFAVEIHAPGICAEADLEGEGRVYVDGDTSGVSHRAAEVAGSDEFHVLAGFQAKSREFVNCLRTREQPSSHFADAVKTMEIAARIAAANPP